MLTCNHSFSQGDPSTSQKGPLLLVPTSQFEQYLNVANQRLGGKLSIPRGSARERFYLTFGEWDTPRPRFLGRADSVSTLEVLKARVLTLPADNLGHLSPGCYQMYRDKIDEIYGSLQLAKRKKDPEAAREKRMQRQKGWGRMLKRVQRYLGLRQTLSHVSSNSKIRFLFGKTRGTNVLPSCDTPRLGFHEASAV
jgi:hypothetical protein